MAYVANIAANVAGKFSSVNIPNPSSGVASYFCVGRACLLPTYALCSILCLFFLVVSVRVRGRIVGVQEPPRVVS
jgi:hypothetical protein